MCEHENPFESMICAMCGAPFAAVMKEPEAIRPHRDPGMVALLSLLFPGAGHAYMGLWAQAVSRAVVVVWTIAVTLLAGVQGGSGSAPMAVVFGLATLALWVVTAHDAFREAGDEKGMVILKSRTFLYVVIGLLALLFVLVFSAAVNLAGAR
jgi:hypothetical protein